MIIHDYSWLFMIIHDYSWYRYPIEFPFYSSFIQIPVGEALHIGYFPDGWTPI